MKNLLTTLAVLFLFASTSQAVTCTSLGNGNWAAPATWSCGAAPVTGDTIIIAFGDTVTLSANTDLTGLPCVLGVYGVLLFDTPSAKLFFECGSTIYIAPGGVLLSSGNGQPSHQIKICNKTVWVGEDGPLTGPLILGDPLPIELVFFKADKAIDYVDFTWQTASELNNDYFTIEGSTDAVNWSELLIVAGALNSTTTIDYSESLSNRVNRNVYFRLKQTDIDGKSSYSVIVSIQLEALVEMNIYPNPSDGNDLSINLPFDDEYELQIISANGRLIHSEIGAGSTLQLRNLDLDAGMYIVRATQGSTQITERLIVR